MIGGIVAIIYLFVFIGIIIFIAWSLKSDQKKDKDFPQPPCPVCKTKMNLVYPYQRWFCESCKEYR
jgi:hypothetical protein